MLIPLDGPELTEYVDRTQRAQTVGITASIVIKPVSGVWPQRPFDFEWCGPENGTVAVADEVLTDTPDLLELLPWKLKQIGRDDYLRLSYYQRETNS